VWALSNQIPGAMPHSYYSDMAETWKSILRGIQKKLHDFSKTALDKIADDAAFVIYTDEAVERLRHLFNQALAQKDITAWAVANDGNAIVALTFLKEIGVAVPQDISVVGFDDTTQAFEFGLTSYNFSLAAVAHRMLTFVLNPRGEPRAGNCGPIEVPGLIIARTSTERI
jgi:DNA-binding LacI/PurR family transcriptional regulator